MLTLTPALVIDYHNLISLPLGRSQRSHIPKDRIPTQFLWRFAFIFPSRYSDDYCRCYTPSVRIHRFKRPNSYQVGVTIPQDAAKYTEQH